MARAHDGLPTTEGAATTAPARRQYDSTLRRQRAGETRARIIAAGSELLHGSSVRDWHGLTIRAVAEKAGVNERTVYRHFVNEQGLRDAVMHEFEEEAGIDLRGMQLADVADVTARIFAHVSSYPPDARQPLDPTLLDAKRRQHEALLAAVAAEAGTWSEEDRTAAAGARTRRVVGRRQLRAHGRGLADGTRRGHPGHQLGDRIDPSGRCGRARVGSRHQHRKALQGSHPASTLGVDVGDRGRVQPSAVAYQDTCGRLEGLGQLVPQGQEILGGCGRHLMAPPMAPEDPFSTRMTVWPESSPCCNETSTFMYCAAAPASASATLLPRSATAFQSSDQLTLNFRASSAAATVARALAAFPDDREGVTNFVFAIRGSYRPRRRMSRGLPRCGTGPRGSDPQVDTPVGRQGDLRSGVPIVDRCGLRGIERPGSPRRAQGPERRVGQQAALPSSGPAPVSSYGIERVLLTARNGPSWPRRRHNRPG